jgi:AraC-like DNA-binding protein
MEDRLAAAIAAHATREGPAATAIPGLYLSRYTTITAPPHAVDRAILCVVAQGAKCVLHDQTRHEYGGGSYFVLPLDLPLVGQISAATPEAPCLGVTLELDFAELATLGAGVGAEPAGPTGALPGSTPAAGSAGGLAVTLLDAALRDALTRLIDLLAAPAEIPVLAPLVRREIFYRLLAGPHGPLLRRLATAGGPAQRIAAALDWLRRRALGPVRTADLAREVGMSPSTMHAWFREVTGMSPLQFRTQVRLHEARRLMLTEAADAATASRQVGYESPSQFSREYRRLFGAPPRRDVARLSMAAGVGRVPAAAAP